MSTRVLWIALAISLALNLSFVGAWGYAAVTASESFDDGNDSIERLAEHLVLTPEQRDGLTALREAARERWRGLSEASGSLRETVVEGLAGPSFDRTAMETLVRERMTLRAGVVAETMGDLHAYIQTLTSEQRQAFLELAKQRGFLRSLFGSRRRASESK